MQHERLLVWLDYKPLSIEPGGAWWAAVRGVAKSRTRLSDFTFTFPDTHTNTTHWLVILGIATGSSFPSSLH